tara:strand:+ start:114 stop:452 length:339 start_codon:yes stop_codon:yes gene_type:complete
MNYLKILEKLKKFRDERDWKQFHDSKNLSLALSIEASELNELFLWKENEELEQIDKDKIAEELADILSYAFLLADKHDLDPFQIISDKISKNAKKYPVDKSKGVSTKYNELK